MILLHRQKPRLTGNTSCFLRLGEGQLRQEWGDPQKGRTDRTDVYEGGESRGLQAKGCTLWCLGHQTLCVDDRCSWVQGRRTRKTDWRVRARLSETPPQNR